MMPTRIVFLDIDGVLNSKQWLAQPEVTAHRTVSPSDEHAMLQRLIDPACVACLNQILEETGAVVVLSSSWRKKYDLNQIVNVLTARGFRGQIVGVTPIDQVQSSRKNEISQWLEENGAQGCHYIVLDDESDLGIRPEACVWTSDATGLTEAEVVQAVTQLSLCSLAGS